MLCHTVLDYAAATRTCVCVCVVVVADSYTCQAFRAPPIWRMACCCCVCVVASHPLTCTTLCGTRAGCSPTYTCVCVSRGDKVCMQQQQAASSMLSTPNKTLRMGKWLTQRTLTHRLPGALSLLTKEGKRALASTWSQGLGMLRVFLRLGRWNSGPYQMESPACCCSCDPLPYLHMCVCVCVREGRVLTLTPLLTHVCACVNGGVCSLSLPYTCAHVCVCA